MHIAIAGNIGSGKTSLTGILAKHYGWDAHYEDADNNPYLSDFYDDMKRWSLNLQVYFLKERFEQILKIRKTGQDIIQDRTIYEDAEIFAANLADMDLMSKRDFENYLHLFRLMVSLIVPPDLIIYLKASVPTLVSRIQKRGREYEESIRIDYLKNLNKRYNRWVENYKDGKLLVLDADALDFFENPKDINIILNKMEAELHGLF